MENKPTLMCPEVVIFANKAIVTRLQVKNFASRQLFAAQAAGEAS